MSALVVVVLAVGVSTSAVLVALVVGLIRHLKVLTRSLRQYRDEIQPLLLDIRDQSDRARRRAEEVPARVPRPGPGARLRKTS